MTGTLRFYDAEFPPHPPPPGMDGVCYYLPGGDASRGWTRADLASQPARYRLPVFVRSDPGQASAVGDAHTALAQLRAFGQPDGTLVAWDSETAADAAYMRVVYSVIGGAGYRLIDYGSQSTVFGNDVPDGYYWGADWTGSPHLHAGDKMTQWVNFSGYDEDLAEATLPFWDTRRPAAASANSKEDDVVIRRADHGQEGLTWCCTGRHQPPGPVRLLDASEDQRGPAGREAGDAARPVRRGD